MLTGNSVTCVVRLRGVADDTRVPNMAHAHLPDILQDSGREIIQFATTVVGYRSILLAGRVTVAIQSCKNLIDDGFSL